MTKELAVALIFLCTTSVLTTIDIVADLSEGTSVQHVAVEVGVIVLGIIGSIMIGHRLISHFRSEIRRNKQDLTALRRQADQWKSEAQTVLQGLAVEIDRQFSQWSFSKAEKEIALFLIKGLSLKEIADIRGVHEKTVRLQSSALYKKAGLTGRAELAAFFLEDLLLPQYPDRPVV